MERTHNVTDLRLRHENELGTAQAPQTENSTGTASAFHKFSTGIFNFCVVIYLIIQANIQSLVDR
jgi:hypothetical protein